jgi:hypothetical protein
MKENKSITLEVNSAEIEAFEKLIENGFQSAPDEITILKAMAFLTNIHQAYEAGQVVGSLDKPKRILSKVKEVDYLNKVIEQQRWRISGLMAVPLLQGTMNLFTGANNTAILMDSLFNPEEVEIHSTNEHSGEDFRVKPRDIFAIKSEKKKKIIFLTKPIRPLKGGANRYSIELDTDFDELLKEINIKSQILYRVSNSYAINVFEYAFSKPKKFVLSNSPKDKFYNDILEIGIDS